MFEKPTITKQTLDPQAKLVLLLALFVVLCALLSTIANPSGYKVAIIGFKNYFQMFGIMAAFAVLRFSPTEATKFVRLLLTLAFLQLPFVLHQFFVLVPQRSSVIAAAHNIVPVDVVAGTFGAIMMGGGRSSSLAFLDAIVFVLLLSQWRLAQRTTKSLILSALIITLPVLLNEAKIFIVLVPVGLFLVFKDQILLNPFKAVLASTLLLGMMVGLLGIYTLLPGSGNYRTQTIEEFFNSSVAYNVGEQGYGNGYLNRSTVYQFWWQENIGHGDFTKALLGHGLGVTNPASVVTTNTLANTRYRGYSIGLTGLSTLLWEMGLLGTLCTLMFLYQTYRLGATLADRWHNSKHWPTIKAAQIAMPMIGLNLLHNNFFMTDLSFQTLIMLLMGYLVALSRFTPEQNNEIIL